MGQFKIRKSFRAKRLRLQINMAGELSVVVPRWSSEHAALKFAQEHADWIEKQLLRVKKKDPNAFYYLGETFTKEEIMERAKGDLKTFYKKKANEIIRDRLEYWNEFYGFRYHRVTFRNQKTRWGSCSTRGNLNFNWRLAMAPIDVIDYVVVHELCHLQMANHSRRFWELVSQTLPDFKQRRVWLRKNTSLLML